MAETQTDGKLNEQERELVTILIDSDLYLDMDLTERLRLIHRLLASFV